MKKFSFSAIIAIAVLLTACNGSGNSASQLADGVSDSSVVNEALAQEEIEELENVINSLSLCLDSIQVQENLLFKSDENTSKQQVLERMRAFKDLLARKQSEINKLTANSKSNKTVIANLKKMTEFLQQELDTKSKQITKLEEAVKNKDFTIEDLNNALSDANAEVDYLTEENYNKENQLNQAFYIVADKKDLKDLGLLKGGGLFSKKRADYANIDQSMFKKVDIRKFTKLAIDSKSPKLLTEKPEASYKLEENNDGTTTLTITDAKAFWGASPYLIIQK